MTSSLLLGNSCVVEFGRFISILEAMVSFLSAEQEYFRSSVKKGEWKHKGHVVLRYVSTLYDLDKQVFLQYLSPGWIRQVNLHPVGNDKMCSFSPRFISETQC